eukprot:6431528-Prymnesium_polylepis.1
MAPQFSSRVAPNLMAPSRYSQAGTQGAPRFSPPSIFIVIKSRGVALAGTCARTGPSDECSRASLWTMQICFWCDANHGVRAFLCGATHTSTGGCIWASANVMDASIGESTKVALLNSFSAGGSSSGRDDSKRSRSLSMSCSSTIGTTVALPSGCATTANRGTD